MFRSRGWPVYSGEIELPACERASRFGDYPRADLLRGVARREPQDRVEALFELRLRRGLEAPVDQRLGSRERGGVEAGDPACDAIDVGVEVDIG